MESKNKTNLELWDEYWAMLQKKHPDTLYSQDPAEREEEMKNEPPALSVEGLKIVVERPLEPDATPEEIELNKQCKIFLYETLIPMEEFLDKLDRGEADPNDFPLFSESSEEDNSDNMEIPSLIENESDYEPI